jgi:hypothetical protein
MKLQTAFNHSMRCQSRLRDIYSRAKSFTLTGAEISEAKNREIFSDPAYAKCPRWVHSEISGADRVLFEDIQRNWLVWGVWHEGQFLCGWDNYPQAVKDACMAGDGSHPQKHYWLRQETPRGKTLSIEGATATRSYIVTEKAL